MPHHFLAHNAKVTPNTMPKYTYAFLVLLVGDKIRGYVTPVKLKSLNNLQLIVQGFPILEKKNLTEQEKSMIVNNTNSIRQKMALQIKNMIQLEKK